MNIEKPLESCFSPTLARALVFSLKKARSCACDNDMRIVAVTGLAAEDTGQKDSVTPSQFQTVLVRYIVQDSRGHYHRIHDRVGLKKTDDTWDVTESWAQTDQNIATWA